MNGPKEGRIMAIYIKRLLLALAVSFAAALACADDAPRQVWLVSTRDIPHCCVANDALAAMTYSRMNGDSCWSPTDARTFHDDGNTSPIVVFVHGNHTDPDEAVEKGMCAYRAICTECADAYAMPFRYVVWSWPAERMCRHHRDDAQLKAAYGDIESHYLAEWLATLPPDARVSLIGHSFGPRVITSALHLLAGGDIDGQKLPDETLNAWNKTKRHPMRAVLLAAASDADSLAQGGRNELALSLLDQVLVTRNGCDNVLRWYSWLYRRGGPDALGFVGPCCIGDAKNVEVVDLSCSVGKTHDYHRYSFAPELSGKWARYTFLGEAR
jgi:esterase/lipase superfamily enzyme